MGTTQDFKGIGGVQKQAYATAPVSFSFANCHLGLCKCKDFIPKDLTCPPIEHHEAICNLRKLLEEPLSQKSYDIHSFYLNNYMEACVDGFYINDMPYLTRVIEILAERIARTGIYRRYLKKILKISALIPLVYSDADKIEGIVYFGKYLSILGLLALWLTEKKLRLLVYTALTELLTNTNRKFVNSIEIHFRFVAVENSHLPEIITQLLEISAEDEYFHILKISLALSQISNVTCKKMMVTDAANFLLVRLLPCDDTNESNADVLINLSTSKEFLETCNITCHILINLVSSLRKETDEMVLRSITPKDNLIWAIRFLLRGLIYHGVHTRNVRNMLMEFILLCMDIFPYLDIISTYLANDLAELSVASEINAVTECTDCEECLCTVKFENNDEDICFKKMLLMSLCFIDKFPLLVAIFEMKNVIKGLLKLVSPDYVTIWHPKDQDSLRNYALTSLNRIVTPLIDDFIKNEGTLSLLKAIEHYTQPSISSCSSREDLIDFLKVLHKISENSAISKTNPKVCSVITKLCGHLLDGEYITYHDQEILTYCFCILSFYDNDNDNNNNNNNKNPTNSPTNNSTNNSNDNSTDADDHDDDENCYSIQIPLNYLRRILNPRTNDSCFNPRTIIAALNYLWTILLSEDEKIQEFIKVEGVYVLLDIIDICPLPVQVIGLGCLVDIISENQYSLPFILTWRGVTNKKQIFISLLARIFRDECKKIGTRLNENDIIIDIFNPLMGRIQYQQIAVNNKQLDPNNALADLLGSARPKIYALMQILNTRYEENVNLINDHYKIGITPISRNDLIILHLANNYFALKISEAWHELSQSLIVSNIDPIDVDAQMIFNLTEKMQMWNEGVQKNQEIILNLEIRKDINLELRLYEIFRECRLQHAIDALKELKYFAKTTDRMFREAHKNKQKVRMETEKYESLYKVYFQTFIKDLNATALYNMDFVIPNHIINRMK